MMRIVYIAWSLSFRFGSPNAIHVMHRIFCPAGRVFTGQNLRLFQRMRVRSVVGFDGIFPALGGDSPMTPIGCSYGQKLRIDKNSIDLQD
jgi:hypothetical protein